MKKVRYCVPLILPSADTGSPEMPFRIKSASKVFQKRNKAAFANNSGLYIVADDLIIAAENIDEHEKTLHQVLQRAEDLNIKLNFNKPQLHMNEVKYLGTIVTPDGIRSDPTKVKAIIGMPTVISLYKAFMLRLLQFWPYHFFTQ